MRVDVSEPILLGDDWGAGVAADFDHVEHLQEHAVLGVLLGFAPTDGTELVLPTPQLDALPAERVVALLALLRFV